ncbi:hypothetical protein ACX0G7_09630 [Flavitalea antarctica]
MGLFIMYKESANTLLGEPVKVTITTYKKRRFWFRKAVRQDYEVKALSMGSLVRISRILVDLQDMTSVPIKGIINASLDSIRKHSRAMAEIAAIGFTNTKEAPAESLIDLIENNLAPAQLSDIVITIINQIEISKFMKFYKLDNKEEQDEDDKKKNGNLWATIGGLMKYFRCTWDQIMWQMSYANILLLSATVPKYESSKKNGREEDGTEVEGVQDLADFLGIANK